MGRKKERVLENKDVNRDVIVSENQNNLSEDKSAKNDEPIIEEVESVGADKVIVEKDTTTKVKPSSRKVNDPTPKEEVKEMELISKKEIESWYENQTVAMPEYLRVAMRYMKEMDKKTVNDRIIALLEKDIPKEMIQRAKADLKIQIDKGWKKRPPESKFRKTK